MSEKKTKRIKFKGVLIAAACLTALLCGTLTANAATNGALFEGLTLIINGEDVDIKDYITNYKSYKVGDKTYSEIEMEVPDDGSASVRVDGNFEVIPEDETGTQNENDPVMYSIEEN